MSKLNLELQEELFNFFKSRRGKREAYKTTILHFKRRKFSAKEIEEILNLFLEIGMIKEYSFQRYLELTEPLEQLLKLQPEMTLSVLVGLLSNELKYAEFLDSFTAITNG